MWRTASIQVSFLMSTLRSPALGLCKVVIVHVLPMQAIISVWKVDIKVASWCLASVCSDLIDVMINVLCACVSQKFIAMHVCSHIRSSCWTELCVARVESPVFTGDSDLKIFRPSCMVRFVDCIRSLLVRVDCSRSLRAPSVLLRRVLICGSIINRLDPTTFNTDHETSICDPSTLEQRIRHLCWLVIADIKLSFSLLSFSFVFFCRDNSWHLQAFYIGIQPCFVGCLSQLIETSYHINLLDLWKWCGGVVGDSVPYFRLSSLCLMLRTCWMAA